MKPREVRRMLKACGVSRDSYEGLNKAIAVDRTVFLEERVSVSPLHAACQALQGGHDDLWRLTSQNRTRSNRSIEQDGS